MTTPAAGTPAVRGSRGGPIAMFIVGVVLVLLGIGPLAGGIAIAVIAARQADTGAFDSPAVRLSAEGYAIVVPELRMRTTLRQVPDEIVDLQVRVRPDGAADELFIGIGPRAEVADYLDGVAYAELVANRARGGIDFRDVPGSREPGEPGAEDFWVDSDAGEGELQVEIPLRTGDWVIVVMNADGSEGVDVAAGVSARSSLFVPLAVTLLLIGGAMLIGGLALIVAGASGLGGGGLGTSTGSALQQPGAPAAPSDGASSPLAFTGVLAPQLSRALWLVKWLLVIPHVFLLAFLWLATWVTTVVAWFAILFTGRYPRSLFAFNVGVLRWTWRVSFYGYSALGTDEYPPFTLQATAYPAALDVAYPERLSRGLVLVKSWLLAIPHLLIVGALTAGGTWAYRDGDLGDARVSAPSLLGLLVVIAGVILLVTGRYQRPLFDAIMGINRWVYRVLVYVLLMRDEYPPFRFDQGAFDPGPAEPAPSGHDAR